MKVDYDKIPDKEKAVYLKRKHDAAEHQKKAERSLQETVNLDYRYIRMYDYPKNSSVSFGWKRYGNEIQYTVALQSKKDKFSRKDARRVINKRFNTGCQHRFTFISDTHIRDMGPILVAHYNSLRKINGVRNVPKYLRHIPIYLGA